MLYRQNGLVFLLRVCRGCSSRSTALQERRPAFSAPLGRASRLVLQDGPRPPPVLELRPRGRRVHPALFRIHQEQNVLRLQRERFPFLRDFLHAGHVGHLPRGRVADVPDQPHLHHGVLDVGPQRDQPLHVRQLQRSPLVHRQHQRLAAESVARVHAVRAAREHVLDAFCLLVRVLLEQGRHAVLLEVVLQRHHLRRVLPQIHLFTSRVLTSRVLHPRANQPRNVVVGRFAHRVHQVHELPPRDVVQLGVLLDRVPDLLQRADLVLENVFLLPQHLPLAVVLRLRHLPEVLQLVRVRLLELLRASGEGEEEVRREHHAVEPLRVPQQGEPVALLVHFSHDDLLRVLLHVVLELPHVVGRRLPPVHERVKHHLLRPLPHLVFRLVGDPVVGAHFGHQPLDVVLQGQQPHILVRLVLAVDRRARAGRLAPDQLRGENKPLPLFGKERVAGSILGNGGGVLDRKTHLEQEPADGLRLRHPLIPQIGVRSHVQCKVVSHVHLLTQLENATRLSRHVCHGLASLF
mmetsp:Transcript_10788/g.26446  ORF Transcript_10788/g.26446 Transcript_10788/m.26446 type:complete len:520 (+) Transcript_10788:876-2435(+)